VADRYWGYIKDQPDRSGDEEWVLASDYDLVEAELAAANRKIADLEWKEITPDSLSLPKLGDEVIGEHHIIPNPWYPAISSVTDWHERNLFTAQHWIDRGWHSYRPLNALARAAEEKP